MNTRSIAKGLVPPLLWAGLRRVALPLAGRLRFTGDYATWAEAQRASKGYAAAEILETTRIAMNKVRSGQAVFERDSVLLAQPEPPYELIAGLLRVALASGGRLSVLDFGGALGSSYYQCRPLLDTVGSLRWNVVEQAAHVACGKAEFSSEHLAFYDTVSECVAAERPNVLLMSSVLQYLPDPYGMLDEMLTYRIPHVIADRTAFLAANRDRLTVQQVPASIYPASYPAWFLSKDRFLAKFAREYTLVHNFPALDRLQPEDEPAFYEGFIFERKITAP